ncbi:cuscuta receptor 1-like [Vicia villosa]|uniref:cuscuta receptor 1-like n=1 Tax=Vicia villosa TaxID=3911 RepID=UPI00273B4268|nr:cuscuta receptor 1-like [Vicia villosa]
MKLKSLLVCVMVLVQVLMCCEGCWKQEREALVSLFSRMGDTVYYTKDSIDCCQWDGVECNTTSGRVAKLNLMQFNPEQYWQLNYSDFLIFQDLKTLELSRTQISNCTRTDQGLKYLEVLDLSQNPFENAMSILSCLDGLSSLKSLSLAAGDYGSYFENTPLHTFQTVLKTIPSKLPHLEVLDISAYNLTNEILPSLKGFTSTKELHLGNIGLDSDLHIQELWDILKNLEILDISGNRFNDTDITSALSGLSSLKSLSLARSEITRKTIHNISKLRNLEILDLTDIDLNGSFDISVFHGLSNLEYLTLDFSNLKNEFFKSIGDVPSLKVLSAKYCGINGTLPIADWWKLKKLEILDLSYNNFVGKLPSSFVNMTSLRTLTLTNNHFIGNIGPNLATFTSLEYLNFERNQLEFPISFTLFSNHSNLKFIYGNENKVIPDSHSSLKTWVPKFQLQVLQLSSTTEANSIPLPNFLLYQNNLTDVDFTNCKLRGEFPNSLLENNTKLESLVLRNCSLNGDFQLPSRPHLNMAKIDVSSNIITGQMLSNNISSIFPNLRSLNMSRNSIHGSVPNEVSYLSTLYELDLSDNELSGEIPHMLFMSSFLEYLLLDGNSLSGNIPSNFSNLFNLENLDISNNKFIGKIPSHIKNCSSLIELSMSNNNFEGSIPSELAQLETLAFLDLSQNNLVGCVPSFESYSTTLIHLSDNKFSCLSKNMFKKGSPLVALDLSNNEITNGIHDLIHNLRYTELSILLMKGNHITGSIPKQLCHLTNLNILDLSYNNFVGEIPSCLGKMPFENSDPEGLREKFNGAVNNSEDINYRFGKERDNFTSKKRIETYTTNVLIYMSGIDLSHNQLNGSIPSEFGHLRRILALNLSNNFFTGKIPATFSNLVQVESLDLSFNMLCGQIPPQLSGLTSLEVFSVAHNNLSGTTPERKGQFITFDESSYEGNQFLCGPPLPTSCNSSGEAPNTLPNDVNMDGDNDSWVDMYVFRVSFVVAYTSVLLVIAIVLFINPYWRQAWFYYIGMVCMNCFYFLEDNLCVF